jgi:hypothetical protein
LNCCKHISGQHTFPPPSSGEGLRVGAGDWSELCYFTYNTHSQSTRRGDIPLFTHLTPTPYPQPLASLLSHFSHCPYPQPLASPLLHCVSWPPTYGGRELTHISRISLSLHRHRGRD